MIQHHHHHHRRHHHHQHHQHHHEVTDFIWENIVVNSLHFGSSNYCDEKDY
jgi:hypothetical protein